MARLTAAFGALFLSLSACDQLPCHVTTPKAEQMAAENARLYAAWKKQPENLAQLAKLSGYLQARKVDDVVPIEELVRSDVNWRRCKAPPFLVPDEKAWPHMVSTLRLVKEEIVPKWGAVEALSVYRSPQINDCLGGASKSAHMQYYAIDMQFRASVERAALINRLCGLHRKIGPSRKMGLGIYKSNRFHIDTLGYRSWGQDQRGASSPCRALQTSTARSSSIKEAKK